jgi:hypothetical protein
MSCMLICTLSTGVDNWRSTLRIRSVGSMCSAEYVTPSTATRVKNAQSRRVESIFEWLVLSSNDEHRETASYRDLNEQTTRQKATPIAEKEQPLLRAERCTAGQFV